MRYSGNHQFTWDAFIFWLFAFAAIIILSVIFILLLNYVKKNLYDRFCKRNIPSDRLKHDALKNGLNEDIKPFSNKLNDARPVTASVNSIWGTWHSILYSIDLTFNPDGTFEMLYKSRARTLARHSIMDGMRILNIGDYREWGTFNYASSQDKPNDTVDHSEEYVLHCEAGGYTDKKEKAHPRNNDVKMNYIKSQFDTSITIIGKHSVEFRKFE